LISLQCVRLAKHIHYVQIRWRCAYGYKYCLSLSYRWYYVYSFLTLVLNSLKSQNNCRLVPIVGGIVSILCNIYHLMCRYLYIQLYKHVYMYILDVSCTLGTRTAVWLTATYRHRPLVPSILMTSFLSNVSRLGRCCPHIIIWNLHMEIVA
jgi:hypothetical protein